MKEGLKIVLLCVAASVLFGIVHDQVTARICVEYFTVGHPPIFGTDDPTWLGLGWGVIATWWMGAILGTLLAICARTGSRPALSWRDLIRPVGMLLGVMFVMAMVGGGVGYALYRCGKIVLLEPFASRIPQAKHGYFLLDGGAHLASYLGGGLGGVALAVRAWRRRSRAAA